MPNQLIDQTSPYLLQHADNPVDWHAWGASALALAVRQDKPILLSIGYSACHWCHVMERECFTDQAIADKMNALFVCIKVDREERPDLDRIYQTAHQLLTQRPGGWPLTVALTPVGHAPFFSGTYFPPEPRHGMPGFGALLADIAAHYRHHHDHMQSHWQSFQQALNQLNPVAGTAALPAAAACLETAAAALGAQFDAVNGGFGAAPKFPHPTQLELLQRHAGGGSTDSRAMVDLTLRCMAAGGLFDQLGGGFYRYSVDAHWRIPHFEKMLYDNAQLMTRYCDAWLASGEPRCKQIAEQAAEWVLSDMQQPDGGYASTLDADSEGVEGKYYVWSEAELRALLTADEYLALETRYGLAGAPNFDGNWHLNIAPDNADPAASEPLDSARRKLLAARARRVRPALDDKILSSWNGLMIKAMARCGRVFARPDFIRSAQLAADFVADALWQQERLFATCRHGRAQLNGYLDDYAMLADGLLELCRAQWRSRDLQLARLLCDALLAQFEAEDGGFFFTAHDHEPLLYRPKSGPDDAIPSGNGVAASTLLKLGYLLGETRYLTAAERTLRLFAPLIERQPSVYGSLTLALLDADDHHKTLILRGPAADLQDWQRALDQAYRPAMDCYAIPTAASDLPAALAVKAAGKQPVAYLCQGLSCSAPITSQRELLDLV